MISVTPDLLTGNIIMSRVRLARNVVGYPFSVTDKCDADEIIKRVERALLKEDFYTLKLSTQNDTRLQSLKESHLISAKLIKNKDRSAVIISKDECVSVMVHEEDLIREQCLMRGLRLSEAYKRLDQTDDLITKNLEIAYDDKLGYLTACPTNLGTGLRASVMLFLPALSESGKFSKIASAMYKKGLTVRGLYGEGSKAEGCMYQISNEVTLGLSENDIIYEVEKTVQEICNTEREEMEKLYGTNTTATMDEAHKSYGILTNAIVLDYVEFLEHIAKVKLGAMMGLININRIDKIDDIISAVRPATICAKYGKPYSEKDGKFLRATYVAQELSKIKE